ncbi:unnamed protein product [Echinostoma caproni]|uniref:Uncharacterized protein n=1 Tax=Echinostoma caproni TaxID=27848 RepID=A0A183BCP9_9TREM|nr:unnamed protein product [Echinostoma caproni]
MPYRKVLRNSINRINHVPSNRSTVYRKFPIHWFRWARPPTRTHPLYSRRRKTHPIMVRKSNPFPMNRFVRVHSKFRDH